MKTRGEGMKKNKRIPKKRSVEKIESKEEYITYD